VFTGSSQEGLRKVFSAKSAPFYRFATQMTLPVLGDEFVDHQLAVFKDRAKRTLNRADALSAFERIEHNPLFFQQWLIALMAHKTLSPDAAIGVVLEELGIQFGFYTHWGKLDSLQRAVIRILAEGERQPYSAAATEQLTKLTQGTSPEVSQIQTAVRRLSRRGMLEKQEDQWRLEDPLLELWIRSRPAEDFIAVP